jgi:hypothetical protein
MDVICRVGLGIKDCRQFENRFTELVKLTLHDVEDSFVWLSWIVPFLGTFLRWLQLSSTVLGRWDFIEMIKLIKRNIEDRKKMRVRSNFK